MSFQNFDLETCFLIISKLIDKPFLDYIYSLPEFQFKVVKKSRETGLIEIHKFNLIDCIKDYIITYCEYKKDTVHLGRNQKLRIRKKTLLVQKGLANFKKEISKKKVFNKP